MRKVGLGGTAVFAPSVRPNTFSPIGVDDVITRHGESALWFRMQPCPCPQDQRTSDCRLCKDGYLQTFQKSFLVESETVRADGHFLFTRYAPITEISKLHLRAEGANHELHVKRIHPDRVEIEEELRDWNAVSMDYYVSMTEEKQFEIEVSNDYRIRPMFEGAFQGQEAASPVYAVLVGVQELYFRKSGQTQFKAIEHAGLTLKDIVFDRRLTGTVRGRVIVFDPIHVAYHTLQAGQGQTEQAKITAEIGEMDIIVSQGYKMGPGDIITFLIVELRAQHYVPFRPGKIDRVMNAPIIRIHNCFAKQRVPSGGERIEEYHEGKDFIVVGTDRIMWLRDKPQNGYSIMYDYHPSYRVVHQLETGGLQDRRLPRQYRVRKWSTFNATE